MGHLVLLVRFHPASSCSPFRSFSMYSPRRSYGESDYWAPFGENTTLCAPECHDSWVGDGECDLACNVQARCRPSTPRNPKSHSSHHLCAAGRERAQRLALDGFRALSRRSLLFFSPPRQHCK